MFNPDNFKRSILAVEALGATPAVLVKAWELSKDPNTDLDTFCALLRNDGPLAADFIRLSNSPYYAPAASHSNLNSAINHLGIKEVIRVINLSLAQQLFARDLPSYGISASDYWSASICTALVMEALAEHVGLNPEDAYTVGILHAIGRVLINHVIEEQRFTIYWDGRQPIQDWERASVGFDYAEAGAIVLECWRFPKTTCDTIRGQLQPEPPPEQISMPGLLQFSHRLLELTGLGFKNEYWELPETDLFAQAAGLNAASIKDLVSVCRDDFKGVLQSVDLS